MLAGAQAVRAPRSDQLVGRPRLMERAGADGIPIVLMINFLVGLVTAFQAAIQLKQFGANIFVADLVGLSVTRELAPLDDGHHHRRTLGRGVLGRARHDAGVGGDRRAPHARPRPLSLPRRSRA